MTVVDFTDYVEVDASADLTVTATKVTASTLTNRVDTALFKDYGSNYFTNFNHRMEIQLATSVITSGNPGLFMGWGLSTASNIRTIVDMSNANSGFNLRIGQTAGGAQNTIALYDEAGGFTAFTASDNLPMTYYVGIQRVGAALTASIYHDAGYSDLAQEIEVFGSSATTPFRTHMALAAAEIPADVDYSSGYVKNFDPDLPVSVIVATSLRKNFNVTRKAIISMVGQPSVGMGSEN